MADLDHPQGIATQIRLVAALRWLILRNSLRRKNNRLDLIGLIVSGVFAAVFVVGMSAAFYAGGYALVSRDRISWIALLFWAIFLFWQVFPVFAVGFGSGFEFRNLMRFPLRLSAFYIIGLAYGLAAFSAVAAVCWLLSMTAGVAMADISLFPVILLVAASFLLLNVTIERLLGSWLERLMARRRSRELFIGLFILVVVGVQFIAPFLEHYGASLRPIVLRALPYLSVFPPGLAGRAVVGASQHDFVAVLQGLAGLYVYIAIFSLLLWQRFATQYRGEELSETPAPQRASRNQSRRPAESTDTLRGLPPRVAAVVRKEFRYLFRNGYTFISLLLPPLLVVFFTFQFSSGHHKAGANLTPDLFFPGMMAYLLLILLAPAYNSFGYEGKGIQTYFMFPVRFNDVLLGKNLLMASLLFVEIAISTIVFAFRVGLPSAPRLMATLAAVVFAAVGQLAIANWSSLSFPRKMEFGQMRNQRQSGIAVLLAFGVQFVLGGLSLLIFFAGKWTGNVWLPAEAFAFLSAAAVAGYAASLDPLNRLAQAKREVLIETLCR